MASKEEWIAKDMSHFAAFLATMTTEELSEAVMPTVLKACKRSGEKVTIVLAELLGGLSADLSAFCGTGNDSILAQLSSFLLVEVCERLRLLLVSHLYFD